MRLFRQPACTRPDNRRLSLLAVLLGLALAGAWMQNGSYAASPGHAAAPSANANDPSTSIITHTSVTYEFNQRLVFTASLAGAQPLQWGRVFFQEQGSTRTHIGEAQLLPQNDRVILTYTQDLAASPLRPFTWVDYHWEAQSPNGQIIKSAAQRFYYRDNRFIWNMLEEKPFRVFWYQGEVPFAQAILDAAQQGMLQVQNLAPLPAPANLDIYIYADFQDLQGALGPASAAWVAGHADPDLGLIVASIPTGPDQQMLIEQRIPHELMHILLYQVTNPGYRNLPNWINEGLASQAELYPNSDYALVLEDAVKHNTLIPLPNLCSSFPRDASQALLAYAQSASFVEYVRRTYGSDKLQALISAYANGMDCQRGAQQSLGRSLTQLERSWRRDALAENTAATAAANLLPWFILLLAALLGPSVFLFHRRTAP